MGEGPDHLGLLHPARNPGRPPSRLPIPTSSLGILPLQGVGDLLGSLGHGKTPGPLGGRASVQFYGHTPRDPGNLA